MWVFFMLGIWVNEEGSLRYVIGGYWECRYINWNLCNMKGMVSYVYKKEVWVLL